MSGQTLDAGRGRRGEVSVHGVFHFSELRLRSSLLPLLPLQPLPRQAFLGRLVRRAPLGRRLLTRQRRPRGAVRPRRARSRLSRRRRRSLVRAGVGFRLDGEPSRGWWCSREARRFGRRRRAKEARRAVFPLVLDAHGCRGADAVVLGRAREEGRVAAVEGLEGGGSLLRGAEGDVGVGGGRVGSRGVDGDACEVAVGGEGGAQVGVRDGRGEASDPQDRLWVGRDGDRGGAGWSLPRRGRRRVCPGACRVARRARCGRRGARRRRERHGRVARLSGPLA